MTWLVQEWMAPIVQREARKAARAFPEFGLTSDDLVNEFYVWMHKHPDKEWEGLDPERPDHVDFFGRTAYYTTRQFITRGDAYRASKADLLRVVQPDRTPPGGEVDLDLESGPEEGKSYTRDELEALIPGIWSVDVAVYGVQSEVQRDPEMPKGQGPNPAHGFTSAAKVADVKRAWERADLDRRFDRLAAQIRYERRDWDNRRG